MTNDVNNAGTWLESTLIDSSQVASNVMKLRFKIPNWPGHASGQHVDVRLTSTDGYSAERSYSIANPFIDSAVERDVVELGVELLENGEVSPYLWTLKPGDKIEIRGPIGGHFVWNADTVNPLVLIAGGSGMVPLMSMLRLNVEKRDKTRPIVFIISLRTVDRLLYADELQRIQTEYPNVRVAVTLTEAIPQGWQGYSRRIDAEMFTAEIGPVLMKEPRIYICGPTKFVEAAAKMLLDMGINRDLIKTERFGG